MAYEQAQNRRKKLMKTYGQIKGMRKHYSGSGVWYDEDRGFYYKYTASNTLLAMQSHYVSIATKRLGSLRIF